MGKNEIKMNEIRDKLKFFSKIYCTNYYYTDGNEKRSCIVFPSRTFYFFIICYLVLFFLFFTSILHYFIRSVSSFGINFIRKEFDIIPVIFLPCIIRFPDVIFTKKKKPSRLHDNYVYVSSAVFLHAMQ